MWKLIRDNIVAAIVTGIIGIPFMILGAWIIQDARFEPTPTPMIVGDDGNSVKVELVTETPPLPTGTPEFTRITEENADQLTELMRLDGKIGFSISYSPDGTLLGVASSGGIYFYDAETLDEISFIDTGGNPTTIAFSPDGQTVASSQRDASEADDSYYYPIKIWRVSDNSLIHTLDGHESTVFDIAFSPDKDSSLLASAGYSDNTVKVWKVNDGTLIRTLRDHNNSVFSVAFSSDGSLLASGSEDNTIKIWQVSNGIVTHSLNDHTGNIWSVAFSPDSSLLASGSSDNTVKVWQVNNGSLIHSLNGHLLSVKNVTFSSDGSVIASGSEDNVVNVWKVDDGSFIRSLKDNTGTIRNIVFSPDGSRLVSSAYGNSSNTREIVVWGILP